MYSFLHPNPFGSVSRIVFKSVGTAQKDRLGVWDCHIPKIQPQPYRQGRVFFSVGERGLSRAAFVVSLQSTNVWKLDDLAEPRWLNGPMLWRVHAQ